MISEKRIKAREALENWKPSSEEFIDQHKDINFNPDDETPKVSIEDVPEIIINSVAFSNYKSYCETLVLYSCLGESGRRYYKYYQPTDDIESNFLKLANEKIHSIVEYDLDQITIDTEVLNMSIPIDRKKEPYNYGDRLSMYKLFDRSGQDHLVISYNVNQAIVHLSLKGVDIDDDAKSYIVNMITL